MSGGQPGPERPTSIRVTKETRAKLQALKKELGFRNLSALFNYTILEMTKGQTIPPTEYSVIFDRLGTRPVIVTGESGSGKTTAVKNLLSHWGGSAFVLDVTSPEGKKTGEYPEFRTVDFGDVFSTALWKRENERVRFLTNQESKDAARGEASSIFGHLNYLKSAGFLRNWVVVIEEGHNFAQDPNLRAFLIEGRKFCRKVILVTTDWRVYEGIARVFKPKPWELESPSPATNQPEVSAGG